MTDEHKVFFEWPHSEPTEVIVCGSFNDWARTCHLTKGPTGFTGFIHIPWGSKITYKYIVDGAWRIHPEEPTESDEDGNINNMYIAPPQPDDNGKPASAGAPGDAPRDTSQLVAHFADTITAREGTSSTLDYVASGFGAAVNSIVGVDPINAEQYALIQVQIALPTPVQSAETPGTELDATGSSVSDGVPLSSVPAEVPSSQRHVSETHEHPRAALTPEFPEKTASDISVPIDPVNATEDHTTSIPVAELALTPAEDSIGLIHTAVKVNEDVPAAVEDNTNKVEGIPMTVEEPHTAVEKTPSAESVLAEKATATTSKVLDAPIAAAGDKASLVTSEDPASTPEEHSKEASQVLKTPEAITPASDLNPSLVLASEGIPTPSSFPEEKAMPQDMPIVPSAPLQKGLDKLEQTELAPVANEVKVQPAPVVDDVATRSEIAEAGLAAQPQAQKEMEESVISLPAGQIFTSPVENGTESLVEPRSVKQGNEVLETEAKAETTQGESTSLSTRVSAPASELLPAPVQKTEATATETISASTVTAVPTEPRPAADADVRPENPSVSPVEVAQSAPTPIPQATPLELGPTLPTSVSETAHEPAPKTETTPILRSESAPTQDAPEPVAPLNDHTEEAVVSAPVSAPDTKAFPATVSPTASPSKSGKAVPERKKKLSIFGKIKHFFESNKGKSKDKFGN
ncbi:hypothetical protein C0993_006994 [Termitomyces sp. T159_Od127]|nr:hypothetical protein C0993_006994 [Termitomyces sp. T159_Od127]